MGKNDLAERVISGGGSGSPDQRTWLDVDLNRRRDKRMEEILRGQRDYWNGGSGQPLLTSGEIVMGYDQLMWDMLEARYGNGWDGRINQRGIREASYGQVGIPNINLLIGSRNYPETLFRVKVMAVLGKTDDGGQMRLLVAPHWAGVRKIESREINYSFGEMTEEAAIAMVLNNIERIARGKRSGDTGRLGQADVVREICVKKDDLRLIIDEGAIGRRYRYGASR